MIAYLKGKLAHKDPTFLIIDTGGVAYEAKISLNTFGAIKEKEEATIHTHLHSNTNDGSQTLFGFFDLSEKRKFQDLISISGVGPSVALMILSSLEPAELRNAIINEDAAFIQRVKGVGAKTAQRIVLELKDKMMKEDNSEIDSKIISTTSNTLLHEALSALQTLGINKSKAEKTVVNIIKEHNNQIDLEHLIKETLRRF